MAGLQIKEEEELWSYGQLVSGLKSGKFKRIVVMTGAGISVSAGIPDFRTPGTGLYDNLKEYNLPHPEAIFTLDYFKEKPEPFYKFAKNFDLDNFEATPTHYFIKLLADKKLLHKNLTQNIDNLEEKTGIDMDQYVCQAHGANRGAVCANGCKDKDANAMQQAIKNDKVLYCDKCQVPIKPDIVFFGEALPQNFFATVNQLDATDLLLVMGTALAVSPFKNIVGMVDKDVPKVLFNMTNVFETSGYDFDKPQHNKILVKGKCDESIIELVKELGWADEFRAILPECHKDKI